jgi:hypothetical protein
VRKDEIQEGVFKSQVALPSAAAEPYKFNDKVLKVSSVGV